MITIGNGKIGLFVTYFICFRSNALKKLKSGRVEALVCTDVGARGIDIDDCDLVLNYDLAPLPATHIHRLVQKLLGFTIFLRLKVFLIKVTVPM